MASNIEGQMDYFAYKNILTVYGNLQYVKVWQFKALSIGSGVSHGFATTDLPNYDGTSLYYMGVVFTIATTSASGYLKLFAFHRNINYGTVKVEIDVNITGNAHYREDNHIIACESIDRIVGFYVVSASIKVFMAALPGSQMSPSSLLYKNISTSSSNVNNLRVAKLSDTSVITAFTNTANSSVQAQVITFDATGNVTTGAVATIEASWGAFWFDCLVRISSTKALLVYNNASNTLIARVLDVSGTTITVSAASNLGSFTSVHGAAIAYDNISGKVMLSWVNTSSQVGYGVITVSGSTATLGTTGLTFVGINPTGNVRLLRVDNRTFAGYVRDGSSGNSQHTRTFIVDIADTGNAAYVADDIVTSFYCYGIFPYTSSPGVFGYVGNNTSYNSIQLVELVIEYTKVSKTTTQNLTASVGYLAPSLVTGQSSREYLWQVDENTWKMMASTGKVTITLSGSTLSATIKYYLPTYAASTIAGQVRIASDGSEFVRPTADNIAFLSEGATNINTTTIPSSFLTVRGRLIGYAKEAGVYGDSVIVDVGPFITGASLVPGKTMYIDRNYGFNYTSGTEIGVAVSTTKFKLKTFI
jgi:hypothetical protein